MSRRFQHLSSFLSSWFHQDFDIVGNTLEEILNSYLVSAGREDMSNIRSDIRDFFVSYPLITSRELEETLGLEVDPLGFSTSGKEFLLAIDQKLSTAVGGIDA